MLSKTFLFSFVVFLFTQINLYGFEKEFSYEIRGRVVDNYSKPVAGATIRIKSPEYSDGCIVYMESTDDNGMFTIKKQLNMPIPEWTLFAWDDSRLPEGTNDLLSIGDVLSTEFLSSLGGQKIVTIENQITDLGDIQLQSRQYPILIQLLDSDGKALIKESDEYGFNPWWIVRDSHGDIISEGGNAYVHFRFSDSAVMNALPEGNWQLEVSDDNGSGFEVSQIVNVQPSEVLQKTTLKLKKVSIKFEGRKRFPFSAKVARQKIEKMGFEFSQESFEKRVLNGNDKAVVLFLNAGMNPNILTKNNIFLRDSISRPRVLKVLLEAGANVNGKTEDGITALIYASGWSVIPISTVKMLLDAGADVKTKDNEGRDAISFSQRDDDRQEVTELLKSYLGKKKTK